MKKIVLTQDGEFGFEVFLGATQKVLWGGKELIISSVEIDSEIQIKLDLLKFFKENVEKLP